MAARSTPDGYTLVIVLIGTMAINPHLCVALSKGVHLTFKSLKPKDYSDQPQTLGEYQKKRRKELGCSGGRWRSDGHQTLGPTSTGRRTKPSRWRPNSGGSLSSSVSTHSRQPRPWQSSLPATASDRLDLRSGGSAAQVGHRDPDPMPQRDLAFARLPIRGLGTLSRAGQATRRSYPGAASPSEALGPAQRGEWSLGGSANLAI